MHVVSRFLVIFFLALFVAGATAEISDRSASIAGDSVQGFQYKTALRNSQQAIGRLVSNHRLTDSAGKALRFSEFAGKPLVLSLVYTSCYAICPTTVKHLAKVVEKARSTLGEDSFNVAVLGFDTRFDSPLAMKQFTRKQGIDSANWFALSADEHTIEAIARELGFEFFASPNGFDHIVQATVIDADSRIYRQVYGEVFDTPLLLGPLMDLVLDRPKPNQTLVDELVDKVRFFCTTYDPATDSYRFDYSLFVGMIIGGMIIVLTMAFIFREYMAGRGRPHA